MHRPALLPEENCKFTIPITKSNIVTTYSYQTVIQMIMAICFKNILNVLEL